MAILTKPDLRRQILAARRALPSAVRAHETRLLRTHIAQLAADVQTIAAYIPVGSEPGADPDAVPLLDGLSGLRILLPIARTGQPMQWAVYRRGALVPAPFGLREPGPPWLDPQTIAQADIVLVPALAVARDGTRLGRGAGFYDRALRLADPATPLVAVVRDDELLDALPAESHDVPVTHVVTPSGGPVPLGVRE
ncbi:5-formyltetrahydrofolate cyclo-ligase [Mycolicibacterium sp. 22603]|uniref:5-formyltetrahydrofolate cyclo-ligase n=1 Tax=Mycolicibacterium sp. 22603 TaxID=3453950 RepID=UPI003F852184